MRPHDADVLPAGTLLGDKAAALLTTERLQPFMRELCELGYAYLLVDAPPLLGIGDAQILASQCDEMLVVSRIRSLHLDNLLDLRAMLDRLPIKPLGTVVIGGNATSSPYYAARPELVTADDEVLAMTDELLRR
jgi:Mrp family chromosome partitioning ATPase